MFYILISSGVHKFYHGLVSCFFSLSVLPCIIISWEQFWNIWSFSFEHCLLLFQDNLFFITFSINKSWTSILILIIKYFRTTKSVVRHWCKKEMLIQCTSNWYVTHYGKLLSTFTVTCMYTINKMFYNYRPFDLLSVTVLELEQSRQLWTLFKTK